LRNNNVHILLEGYDRLWQVLDVHPKRGKMSAQHIAERCYERSLQEVAVDAQLLVLGIARSLRRPEVR
jgi:hypothetical protein